MKEWFRLAGSPSVRKRATRTALIVGSILLAINHGDALLQGDFTMLRLIRMALTVIVPYAVSTVSSVGAMRELQRQAEPPPLPHPVPLRRSA